MGLVLCGCAAAGATGAAQSGYAESKGGGGSSEGGGGTSEAGSKDGGGASEDTARPRYPELADQASLYFDGFGLDESDEDELDPELRKAQDLEVEEFARRLNDVFGGTVRSWVSWATPPHRQLST